MENNYNNEENKVQQNVNTFNASEQAEKFNQAMGVNTEKKSKVNLDNSTIMGILSYIGLLALIPYFKEKEDSFVIFHAKQGMNLLILEIIAYYAASLLERFLRMPGFFTALIEIGSIILSVLGIVNVIHKETKELPLINQVKIIK
ncbi:MAG: hypothetical protein IJ068_01105 [Bacilli bacterium]|nr:hypothetical protein [Bacilli bacterium]